MKALNSLIIFLLLCSPALAVTEYKVVVAPSGGNYTTVEAAVNGNETNLTTSNVINGSLTRGAVSGAITQTGTGATATIISKTATQMLTGAITGSPNSNGTWYPSADGSDATNAWTPTTAGDSVQFSVEISGDWTGTGVIYTEFTVHNYTTDATRYIKIYTTGDARHSGKWSAKAYTQGFDTWGNNSGSNIVSQYVTVDGLQFYQQKDYGGYGMLVVGNGGEYAVIKNNLLTCRNEPPSYDCGDNIFLDVGNGDTAPVYVYNNISYGSGSGLGFNGGINYLVYNNTFTNNAKGVNGPNCYSYNCLVSFKNNISYNNTTDYSFPYAEVYNQTTSTNNLSKDASTPAYNTYYRSKTLTFVNSTNDFHLVSTDTDAIDKGADLSGTFTTDIDGTTRTGTWDIGADEFVSASTPSYGAVFNGVYGGFYYDAN